jgi:diaminohydroxyphosphoribosylaminopyrimidine deaminase/5-amino-6-(5-phosphoribosylamino)uracil reductase
VVGDDAERFMRRALELARNGWGQTAPNPMVGAVVVRRVAGKRTGAIVGEGFHASFGEPHAEVVALQHAGKRARDATLYVTLEPCRHHGKTPPCTDAILSAGIRRVVMAGRDPTATAGGGAEVLRARGLDVTTGVLEREARELNAPFFHSEVSDLPWTTLKLAVSIETAIANERGTTSWLTSPESRAEVHHLRAGHDAIAVGVGTIVADDPRLTVRDARQPRVPLTRVVFDRALRTPLSAVVVRTARENPTILLTGDASSSRAADLRAAGVQLIPASDLRDGLRQLRAAGIHSLLVEGGAKIASAVLEEGLAHRLVIFQAPVTLGSGALHAFDGAAPSVLGALEQYPVLQRRRLGPDVMTTYALAET